MGFIVFSADASLNVGVLDSFGRIHGGQFVARLQDKCAGPRRHVCTCCWPGHVAGSLFGELDSEREMYV